ncbi:hypothetical protein [Roseicella aquatilis]|uniref:Uncharacterized protein n=1 Tax=Roseicella aquatilis TaxID=2527868 RepID=A0A4R4DU33_9PROT|nr:hypothetical protein [Roseicella aquatilis]TCZ65528.1 hypothetical protein EXY23_04985 [Roseicella aquatilis]
MIRTILLGFIAGCVAAPVFQQGTVFLLHHVGNDLPALAAALGRAAPPFSMAPTRPLGVPALLSQSFWGGGWGVVLALILARLRPPAILFATLFGALALTAVDASLLPWLRGLPLWSGQIPWRELITNGAWGFGVALLLLRPLRLEP